MEYRRCGARTRFGTFCRGYALRNKRRCRQHGGMSTGPRHPSGVAASVQAARAASQARYRAAGLKWPGGRRNHAVAAQVVVERAMSDMRELVERSEEEGSESGRRLARLALGGMEDLERIRATTDFTDPKDRRLIVDVALGAIKAAIKVDETAMKGRQNDRLGELLEKIAAARLTKPADR